MKNIDDILKQALTPSDDPEYRINQDILLKAKKEEYPMKKSIWKTAAAVALPAAAVLVIGSVSIYAARKFLQPEHVAEQMSDSKLTAAFQSEDAVLINETQSYGGYDATLLGTVSGKSLTEYETTCEDGLHDDRTYAVVAIARADGAAMPSVSDDLYGKQSFFVSPLIQGLNPAQYNAFTFRGGFFEIEENGVLYRIAECDNVEIFADRDIYLCVSDSMSYNIDAYAYDEQTGEISRKEDYEGLNALFRLPLDASKADPEAAAEYMKQIDEAFDEPETETELSKEETEITAFIQQLAPENIDEYASPVESARQTIAPDENGTVRYSYELENGAGGSGSMSVADLFPDKTPGITKISGSSHSGTLDSLLVYTFTLNEDGTVTFCAYAPKTKIP